MGERSKSCDWGTVEWEERDRWGWGQDCKDSTWRDPSWASQGSSGLKTGVRQWNLICEHNIWSIIGDVRMEFGIWAESKSRRVSSTFQPPPLKCVIKPVFQGCVPYSCRREASLPVQTGLVDFLLCSSSVWVSSSPIPASHGCVIFISSKYKTLFSVSLSLYFCRFQYHVKHTLSRFGPFLFLVCLLWEGSQSWT